MEHTYHLHKVHANGNDLIVHVAETADVIPSLDAIRYWCDRAIGIGANAFVSLFPADEPTRSAEQVSWAIRGYTSAGIERPIDGDELRAAARILIDAGHVTLAPAETLPLAASHGIHDVQPSGTGGFHLDLGRWRLIRNEPTVAAAGLDVARPGLEVEIAGHRYVVLALAHAGELDALDLRHTPLIDPEPVAAPTITFVIPEDPLVRDSVGRLRYRVWVQGIGEQPSGGAAAAATALAVRHWASGDGASGAPNNWRITGAGGVIQVRMFPTEEGEHIGIAGQAQRVFDTTVPGI